MTKVVSQFQIVAIGTTRDECIEAMDQAMLNLQNFVGGAPWVVVDDDVKKVEAGKIAATISDDQGFCYSGVRSVIYKGPLVKVGEMPLHPGFCLQEISE